MAIHVLTTSEDAKPYVMPVQMMHPTPAENCRSMATMAIEMDRIREELRIQREVARRP